MRKNCSDRARRLLGHVDLALLQTLQQLRRRQVHHLDLAGLVQHAVGHRLADRDAGDLRHHVVQTLEVLDVHRGVDVDAGGQQLLDVVVALGMARAGRVGVRQLVHQRELGSPRQHGIHVHLGQRGAAIGDLPARDHLELGQQRLGLRPAVGLDVADHHVHALRLALVRGFQHGVGLAHAGGVAQEDL